MRRPPKYGNRKTVVDGITFDSMAEAARYRQLRLLEKAGTISDLQLQVTFELVPGVRLLGTKRKLPALRYVADFRYAITATNEVRVEDVKGMKTGIYKIKRHLMKALLNIDIHEI